MIDRKFHLHDGRTGAAITVRVTPRASRNEISEILDDGTIKVRLTAGSGEAKINQALIEYLSKVLEVLPGQIEIVAGTTGKDKLVTINNLDSGTVHSRIIKQLV
jgi:uncharacterized protein